MDKQLIVKYLWGLIKIKVYSEDKNTAVEPESKGLLYKHTVSLMLGKYELLNIIWRTGKYTKEGSPNNGGFLVFSTFKFEEEQSSNDPTFEYAGSDPWTFNSLLPITLRRYIIRLKRRIK